jgi:hypothetical protein
MPPHGFITAPPDGGSEETDMAGKTKKSEEVKAAVEKTQEQLQNVIDDENASPEDKAQASRTMQVLYKAKNVLESGYSHTKAFMKRLYHRIKNLALSAWEWAKNAFSAVVKACASAISWLINACSRGFAAAVDLVDRGVRIVLPNREDEADAAERELVDIAKQQQAEAATG